MLALDAAALSSRMRLGVFLVRSGQATLTPARRTSLGPLQRLARLHTHVRTALLAPRTSHMADSASAAGPDGTSAADSADDSASVDSASSSSAPAASCGQCGEPDARERCAGCRSVLYCDRDCQKAAWPGHKVLCKHLLAKYHGGKPVASARDFVLEYWRPLFPALVDVDALLPPADEELDEAVAFERCRGASMDRVFPGYSTAGSDGERRCIVRASLDLRGSMRESTSLADIAVDCIDRLCPVVLEALLDAGVQPSDVATETSICQDTLKFFIEHSHLTRLGGFFCPANLQILLDSDS